MLSFAKVSVCLSKISVRNQTFNPSSQFWYILRHKLNLTIWWVFGGWRVIYMFLNLRKCMKFIWLIGIPLKMYRAKKVKNTFEEKKIAQDG